MFNQGRLHLISGQELLLSRYVLRSVIARLFGKQIAVTLERSIIAKFAEHALAIGRHADLGIEAAEIVQKATNLVVKNSAKYVEGDRTMKAVENGVQK